MKEHQVVVPRTARYFTLGDIAGQLKEVWFAIHGQGQLASSLLKRFAPLDDGTRLIVAPEALARYYLDNMGMKVGAIWMTREHRLGEISDYVNYLNTVHQEIFSRVDRAKVKVHALGFSQGVATVCRWVNSGVARVDRLIVWAGQLPAELDKEGNWERFRALEEIVLVIGDKDEYAEWTLVEQQEEILRRHDVRYRRVTFDGKHEVKSEVLQQLA